MVDKNEEVATIFLFMAAAMWFLAILIMCMNFYEDRMKRRSEQEEETRLELLKIYEEKERRCESVPNFM